MAKIQQILDECIDRMRNGESIEQCLARFPEHLAELEPLLKVASCVSQISGLEASDTVKARVRCLALDAARTSSRRHSSGWFGWVRNRALVTAAAAILVLLFSGVGIVEASGGSLPGQPLYAVKTTVERVELALTRSDVGKAKLLAKFADRRVDEMDYLVSAGNGDGIEPASISMARDLEKIGRTLGMPASYEAGKASATAVPQPAAAPQMKANDGASKAPMPTVPPAASPTTPARGWATASSDNVVPRPTVDHAEVRRDLEASKNAVELRRALVKAAIRHQVKLEKLLERAQEKDKPAIRHAILRLIQGYKAAAGETVGSGGQPVP
ncbi:MAG: hypothetical protein HYX87_03095 [Chloroflexi bacterium]|nr:hypothetical protein [Chloroflexota bacterium]